MCLVTVSRGNEILLETKKEGSTKNQLGRSELARGCNAAVSLVAALMVVEGGAAKNEEEDHAFARLERSRQGPRARSIGGDTRNGWLFDWIVKLLLRLEFGFEGHDHRQDGDQQRRQRCGGGGLARVLATSAPETGLAVAEEGLAARVIVACTAVEADTALAAAEVLQEVGGSLGQGGGADLARVAAVAAHALTDRQAGVCDARAAVLAGGGVERIGAVGRRYRDLRGGGVAVGAIPTGGAKATVRQPLLSLAVI